MKKLLLFGVLCMNGVFGLTFKSLDFKSGGFIPLKCTGEGANIAPRLRWDRVHPKAKAFALICEDSDAEGEPWVHWLMYNIPSGYRSVDFIKPSVQLLPCCGLMQGLNSWLEFGYNGPMPPQGSGIHHYHFKLYVLNAKLPLAPGALKHEVLNAMHGHILDEAELVGLYERA